MTVGQYKSESDPRGYTPTTEDVRDEWRYNIQEVDMDGNVVVSFDEAGAQFDRWLAEHDAKVRAEALREAAGEADDWKAADGMHGGEWFPSEWAGQVAGWLEHRAARIREQRKEQDRG